MSRLLSRSAWIPLLAFACLTPPRATAQIAARDMSDAANAYLAALDDAERSRGVFQMADLERYDWHFIPRERRGLPWKDMTPAQRHLATALLASGLSQRGFIKASAIMSLEQILLELEQGKGPRRDPDNYSWSIFGKPSLDGTWGWRVEGHHLSVNFTLVAGKGISATPFFLGSNPAEVREGPRAGLRVLAVEEDVGRELLRSLTPEQHKTAVIADEAPKEIITGNKRHISPSDPDGIAASDLAAAQKATLHRLIEEYVRRARPEVADADLKRIEESGFEKVHFAWAGPDMPGQGHYYRIQGPTFLLEFDNTQNNANHIHTVWRDFNGDFGEDLLARHYRETPH